MNLLRLWFGFRRPVPRGVYAASGFALAALKYAVDAAVIYAITGRFWDPASYLHPMLGGRTEPFDNEMLAGSRYVLYAMFALCTVPFSWIGFSMTLRRLVDAGFSPWNALLFFLPVVDLVLMLAGHAAPPRRGSARSLASG